MMEADLLAKLLGDSPVAALIGARAAWGDRAQRWALPALTLNLISTGRDYAHSGAVGLSGRRVQVDCWGASHLQAVTLATAVIAAIEPAETVGATKFGQSFVDNERDFPVEEQPGGVKVHRRSVDFIIWHEPV